MTTLEFNEVERLGSNGSMAPAAYSAGMRGLARKIAEWLRRRRDYHKLMAMDDHLLKDLGLSRSQISAAMDQASPHASARAKARQAANGKGPSGRNVSASGFRQAIVMSSIEAAKSRELMTTFIATPRGRQDGDNSSSRPKRF
jgi:uncharacterized protein YjiS (DUF1127 family)